MSLEKLKQKDGALISQKEAAMYSGWSPGYLKKLMGAGAIRSYITLGGKAKVFKNDIITELERGSVYGTK
tara:strand:- start:4682 stop:4891 length:210 start_codon:yes stop_codon:yes gene_type:complete